MREVALRIAALPVGAPLLDLGGEARADWEKTRRERITAPKSIAVGIDSPKVTMRGAEQASVSFRQTYRSDKLKSQSRKTLELVKTDSRWLIKEEKAGK